MKTVKSKQVLIGAGSPKICVPIVGRTETEILLAAESCLKVPCDIVEWRADYFEGVEKTGEVIKIGKKLQQILLNKPLLFTFRSLAEGGEQLFSVEQYLTLERGMILSGAIDLVDIEFCLPEQVVAELMELARKKQVKTIICQHDFAKTPTKDELIEKLKKMQKIGADICKIAVMPQSSQDVLTLLSATSEMTKKYADRPIITMSMGKLGMISRLGGEVFGSAMTFGLVDQASAPGQIPALELKNILERLRLS